MNIKDITWRNCKSHFDPFDHRQLFTIKLSIYVRSKFQQQAVLKICTPMELAFLQLFPSISLVLVFIK